MRPIVARSLRLAALAMLSGCTTGAAALQTGDGGASCTETAAWRVTAHGTVEYDSMTDVPTSASGTVTSVGASSFTLGDVTVELSPAPASGIGTLQVGADVNVVFDHGVVVTEYGNVLFALVEATTTDGSSAPLALEEGTVQLLTVEPTDSLCTRVAMGAGCFNATTETSAVVNHGIASATLSPGDPPAHLGSGIYGYDVTLVACDRPATSSEAAVVAPPGMSRCATTSLSHTVVSVGVPPLDGAPPRCVGEDITTLVRGSDPAGLGVEARGSVTYDAAMGPGIVIDASGQLDAVDTTASSFVVTTSTGAMTVTVGNVPSTWLEALPVGHEVSAHFDDGLVLTDDAGGLLLAVAAARRFGRPERDVGPVHVASTDVRCALVRPSPPPCDPGGVVVREILDARFTIGSTGVDTHAGAPPARLADATHAFEVAIVGSVAQLDGTVTTYPFRSCDVGYESRTFFAIGLAAP